MRLFKKSSKPTNGMKRIRYANGIRPRVSEILAALLLVALTAAFVLNLFSMAALDQVTPSDVAVEDVFAATDLNIPDSDTTEARRTQAMDSAPNVYRYDPRAREKTQLAVDSVFQLLIEYRELRTSLEAASTQRNDEQIQEQLKQLNELYESKLEPYIPPAVFFSMVEIGELPDLLPVVKGLVDRIYTREFVKDKDELQLVNGEALLLDVEKDQEYLTKGFPPVIDRSELRRFVYGYLRNQEVVHDASSAAVFGLISQVLHPNYQYDEELTTAYRQRAADAVEVSYLRKKEGEIIVRKGERISPIQARFINAQNEKVRSTISWKRVITTVLLLVITLFFLYRLSVLFQRRYAREGAPVFPILVWTGIAGILIIKTSIFVMGAVERSLAMAPILAGGILHYGVPYSLPVALAALLTGGIPAVILAAVLSIMLLMLTAGNIPLTMYMLFTSFAAIYVLRKQAGRSTILLAGIWLGLFHILFTLVLNFHFAAVDDLGRMMAMVVVAFFGGFLVTALVSIMLPLFESAFRITTDIRLLELANMNSKLLVNLSLKAPGTYQHSILVANLVESAAKSINANALLARVGTYYHDIGKMVKPEYFVENQRPGDENRHDRLTPKMSAIILTNHVKDGMKLAEGHKVPDPVARFITEHHGTKLMAFFYNKALNQAEEKGDPVEESDYRYPGPKPTSKETAILMMADAVEAASRTLKAPVTAGKLQNLVNRIIKDLIDDNQFSDCNLTFKELSQIADSLLNSLAGMFHTRIDYPGFDFNQRGGQAQEPSEASPIMRDRETTDGT